MNKSTEAEGFLESENASNKRQTTGEESLEAENIANKRQSKGEESTESEHVTNERQTEREETIESKSITNLTNKRQIEGEESLESENIANKLQAEGEGEYLKSKSVANVRDNRKSEGEESLESKSVTNVANKRLTEAEESLESENVENDSNTEKKREPKTQLEKSAKKKRHQNVNNNDSARTSTATNKTLEEMPPPDDRKYGWGKFQPKLLQRFCTAKWACFWLCWAGAMQGLIVNGFINVVISTIERRFGLRSKQTGLVASGYDIASFICLVPVTYFGGRLNASKARWIAGGVILMGMGSLTFSLPHFLVKPYRATASEMNICIEQTNRTAYSMKDCLDSVTRMGVLANAENHQWVVWLFFAAQLLHGAGASPLYTLGVTFIDENVSKKMSSIYLGIFYTMAIIGPAIGFVLGGQLLFIYTDFLTVDISSLTITSESKVWIGAWWIGFVFAAMACMLLAIPLFGYPKKLPGYEDIQNQKSSEAYNDDSRVAVKHFSQLHELPKAVLHLLKNPTFVFLNLAGASEGMVIAGFAAFLPKEIENQFNISPVWSAMMVGLITVPAGGGGTYLGGYLVKKLKLKCRGIIRLCLLVTIVAACFTICLLLTCPDLKYSGVNVRHPGNIEITLTDVCNADCDCNTRNYDPVCGADGLMYISPCFAGCHEEQTLDQNKIYKNCSCIKETTNGYSAINTMCSSDCNRLLFFAIPCFVMMLFTFVATMPALSATLRCLRDDQRSFGLGIQWIKVRLLGTIPSPMIFGALIDRTCILWQDSCDGAVGACLLYNNKQMSKSMFAIALIAKTCSILFFFFALRFYIPPKKVEINNTHLHDGSDEEIVLGKVIYREPSIKPPVFVE